PAPLMRKLAGQGARLALPVVNARGKSLTFRAWSPGDRLVLGSLGIPEPSPASAELIPAVMLVPLAAFDVRGHRIGYGAGYYDRAIAHLQIKGVNPRLIGVAFDCQQVETVPDEPHDVPLEAILTESGLRRFG
ncbi:5-formyltetrahydrofolate cyclo-ligase, partial [Proteus mirabilis]|uniref:5-formyltetrahydrofolate cyclo-ligase n=1 Tax=Proteus mirabilis TaxID=584 RepID=UPI0013D437C4